MYILFNSFWGVDRPLGLPAHAVYPVLIMIMIIDKMIFTDTPKSREVAMHFIYISLIYVYNFCLLRWHYAQCFCHAIMLKIMLA